jgi:hypothetical protein
VRKSCGIVVGILIFTVASHADNIVNIYSGFTCCSGGGAPYSNLVGTIDSPDVLFLTDSGFNWHPFSLSSFGADILGTVDVASPGNYTFTLNSDDGSLLFIDGGLVVDHGGLTPVLNNATGSVALSAGPHPFEIQFFECCGGDSGVDLYLPDGTSYGAASVPEPSVVMLLLIGLVVLVLVAQPKPASPRKAETIG